MRPHKKQKLSDPVYQFVRLQDGEHLLKQVETPAPLATFEMDIRTRRKGNCIQFQPNVTPDDLLYCVYKVICSQKIHANKMTDVCHLPIPTLQPTLLKMIFSDHAGMFVESFLKFTSLMPQKKGWITKSWNMLFWEAKVLKKRLVELFAFLHRHLQAWKPTPECIVVGVVSFMRALGTRSNAAFYIPRGYDAFKQGKIQLVSCGKNFVYVNMTEAQLFYVNIFRNDDFETFCAAQFLGVRSMPVARKFYREKFYFQPQYADLYDIRYVDDSVSMKYNGSYLSFLHLLDYFMLLPSMVKEDNTDMVHMRDGAKGIEDHLYQSDIFHRLITIIENGKVEAMKVRVPIGRDEVVHASNIVPVLKR